MLSWGSKNKYGHHVALFETKQKINGHYVGHPKLSLCTKFERNPVGVFTFKMAASLNDIKNLFEVHNPQTTPDLDVKFQTI